MSGGETAPTAPEASELRSDRAHLLPAGTLVGEWLILNERGHGGFGTVYRAKHVATGALAAVKVLHPELAKHDSALARFDREITAVRALRHPNIIKTIGNGELHDGRPYLTMEWLDGRDLQEVVRANGPMAPEVALRLLAQVASALDAVHAAGIVHRDIKPTNLIAAGNHVVLVDFGIAKMLEPSSLLRTETGVRLGTPETMAPEQITGGTIDPRTDVYALGLLLFYLLTGRFPFVAETEAEVERMHVTAPRPKVSERSPVSAAIDAVVVRAMSVRPGDRQASAGELFAELERAIVGTTPRAAEAPGIAVRIDVDASHVDDAAAVAIDDVLLDVRDRLRSSGLSIAIDTTNLLLATAAGDDNDLRARIDVITADLARVRIEGVTLRVRTRVGEGLLDLECW